MAVSSDQLRDYLTSDPHGLGFAALWQLNDDSLVAALLNDASKGGPVAVRSVSRGAVLAALAGPFVSVLPTLPLGVQNKWATVLQMLGSADNEIRLVTSDGSPTSAALLCEAAVADGLLTAEQKNALTTRPGSAAEVQWGIGTVVEAHEISAAVPVAVRVAREQAAVAAAEQWKVDTIAELIAIGTARIESAIANRIGVAVGDRFVPATDPFSVAIQSAWDAKKSPPDVSELAILAADEMMRIGGGK